MTDKSEELHSEKWAATRELSGIARALSQLSGAFEHTGNSRLAEDLYHMAGDMHKAIETITGADAQMAHIEAQRAEQATANMVRAALMNLTIGRKDDE